MVHYRKCIRLITLSTLVMLVLILGNWRHEGASMNRQQLASKRVPPRVISALLHNSNAIARPSTHSSSHTPSVTQSRTELAEVVETSTAAPESQHSSKRKGYIMGLHSCDQLTGGAMNFMIYQCLAAHMGPNVYTVEPFVVGSSFGAFIRDIHSKEDFAEKNDVRLSDIYDMDEWYRFSDNLGIRRMPPWEDLLEEGSRQLIYVTKGVTALCHHEPQFEGFFKAFDFKIVRTVCLGERLPGAADLKKNIYGDLDPTTVVVLFRDYFPTSIPGTSCSKGMFWSQLVSSLTPSKRIWTNADAYVKKYLVGSKTNDYMSMMIRLEHAVNNRGGKSITEVVKHCLDKLLDQWRETSLSNGLNTTFITLDTGRFGSYSLPLNAGGYSVWNQTQPFIEDFMHSIYGNRLSYDAWERKFLDMSGLSKGSTGAEGYVGILQKAIAVQGRCIILAGGGTYQDNAVSLFVKLHPVSNCIRRVSF